MAFNVLITGGGCEEPLDGVRYLANFSTGETASRLAELFKNQGCRVLLLAGNKAKVPFLQGLDIIRFRTYSDLAHELKKHLDGESFDLMIQAAAVSDYSIDRIESGSFVFKPGELDKIESSEELKIILKRNPKLIDRIKEWSCNKRILLTGFKLTNNADRDSGLRAVKKLFDTSEADRIVWNDLSEINGEKHKAEIFKNGGISLGRVETVRDLGEFLINDFFSEMKTKQGDYE